jgi:hypothetical protein
MGIEDGDDKGKKPWSTPQIFEAVPWKGSQLPPGEGERTSEDNVDPELLAEARRKGVRILKETSIDDQVEAKHLLGNFADIPRASIVASILGASDKDWKKPDAPNRLHFIAAALVLTQKSADI